MKKALESIDPDLRGYLRQYYRFKITVPLSDLKLKPRDLYVFDGGYHKVPLTSEQEEEIKDLWYVLINCLRDQKYGPVDTRNERHRDSFITKELPNIPYSRNIKLKLYTTCSFDSAWSFSSTIKKMKNTMKEPQNERFRKYRIEVTMEYKCRPIYCSEVRESLVVPEPEYSITRVINKP